MKNSLVNLIDGLNTSDLEVAWSRAADFFAGYGFHITNYAKMSKATGEIEGFLSNMPDGWINHYMAQEYYLDDAYGVHAYKNAQPVIYSRDGESELIVKDGSPCQTMFDEVVECGLINSFCIPIHNAFGCKITGFNLGTDLAYEEFATLVDEHRHELLLAAALVNNKMIDTPHVAPDVPSWFARPGLEELLTQRELEVIKWLAEGHRNARIAQMMDIAPVTVNYHLGEIKRKLGAKTREQAVAIAFKLGLLR